MHEDARRVAVVTGAASGIGRATAKKLLDDGIDVIGVDVDERGLESLETEGATAVTANLADEGGRARAADAVDDRLDYIVNAAGILRFAAFASFTNRDWRDVFAVNVEAVFFLSQLLAPRLRDGGAIVNVASMAAKTGEPDFAAYCASKAAVISLTRSLAFALASRAIRVNCVSPGIIDTPMQDVFVPTLAANAGLSSEEFQANRLTSVPLGRIGTAEEVAAVIVYLLSPAAAYVTGEDINVSAGLVTW